MEQIERNKLNIKLIDENRVLSKKELDKVLLLIRSEIQWKKTMKFNKGQTFEIQNEYSMSDIKKELKDSFINHEEFSAVMVYDKEVIGFINFVKDKIDKDTLTLNHFIVEEQYRGQKLGRKLFNFAVSNIKGMSKFYSAQVINNDNRMRSILAHSGIQDQYITIYRTSKLFIKDF